MSAAPLHGFEPGDVDAELHDEACQASYVRGARMGLWTGGIVGGLAMLLLIKLGQWVGA